MDDGVEGQSVAPRRCEIANVHILVAGRFHLTPQQKGILGGLGFFVVGFFDCYVLDLQGRMHGVSNRVLTQRLCFCLTWNRNIIVQMRPKFKLALPSTMSCDPMFSKWTRCSRKNCSALSTFSRQWIRILPLVGRGKRSPDSISNSLIRFLPSRISTYKSAMRQLTRTKCELTHFVNVFFCTDSRSSARIADTMCKWRAANTRTVINTHQLKL